MIGKLSSDPCVSLMSSAQRLCESVGSTLSPITFTPRFSKSGLQRATYPSSVVQTGVKSFGWENRTAQLSPIHSWKFIGPSVVSAVKSGAISPSLRAICLSFSSKTNSRSTDRESRDADHVLTNAFTSNDSAKSNRYGVRVILSGQQPKTY